MQYKVGDKVKIKSDLIIGEVYNGLIFSPAMEKYKGKTFMIANTIAKNVFTFGIGQGLFNSEMVELIEPVNNDLVLNAQIDLHNFNSVDQNTLITLLNKQIL